MGLVKTTTTGQLQASQVIQFGAKFEIIRNLIQEIGDFESVL